MVQIETEDPQPTVDINQRRRKYYLVNFAKNQHMQTYSFVRNLKPSYQVDQRASLKIYASIAWEPSSVTADTAV